LSGQHLALLVHGLVAIDFHHETPVIPGELVEHTANGCKDGPTSHHGREEPSGKGSCRVVIIIVVFFGGKEIRDEREVFRCIVFSIPSHLFSSAKKNKGT